VAAREAAWEAAWAAEAAEAAEAAAAAAARTKYKYFADGLVKIMKDAEAT
jgi:hypothetical protein